MAFVFVDTCLVHEFKSGFASALDFAIIQVNTLAFFSTFCFATSESTFQSIADITSKTFAFSEKFRVSLCSIVK